MIRLMMMTMITICEMMVMLMTAFNLINLTPGSLYSYTTHGMQ